MNSGKETQSESVADDRTRLIGEISKLKEELGLEKQKSKELSSSMKYLQADIVNLQRQTDRMLIDVRNQARFGLLLELVSIGEDLSRAIEVSCSSDKDTILEGLKMLSVRIQNLLKAEDVLAINPGLGSKMDPRLHEAVAFKESNEVEDGSILSVVRQGYSIGGKVIRPAMVEVVRHVAPTEKNQSSERGSRDVDLIAKNDSKDAQ